MKQYLTSLPVLVAPDPVETLFLYLAAMIEVTSMVLVTERSEQLLQGAPAVPPVEGRGPVSTNVTIDLASKGSAGFRPGGEPGDLGSGESPAQGERPSLASKVKISRSRSTTSVRSFMKQRLGIVRCISSFTLYSLRPGSSAIISRPTRLWW
jgi:hypothetical protein